MKAFIFGHRSLGDMLILDQVKNSLAIDNEYLGEKIDFSRMSLVDENVIVVINKSLQYIDFDKVMGYIKKDVTKPLIVVKKLKTLGAVEFKANMAVSRLTTNKLFIFAGILYVPKSYMKNTFSNTFRGIERDDLRVFFMRGR